MIQSVPEPQDIRDRFCLFFDGGKTSFLADVTTEGDFATLKTMVFAGTVVAVGSNVSHVQPGDL